MKELLETILALITFIATAYVALFAIKIASAAQKTKRYGSEANLYMKLFFKVAIMYIVGLIIFGFNFSNYALELTITFVGTILNTYVLFLIIREKKNTVPN